MVHRPDPTAYRPDVDMNEAEARIIPDAATTKHEGCTTKLGHGAVGQPDVDRLADNVEAMLGNAVSLLQ